MKARGIKQTPLSEATGISQGALSNYKNGRMPKVDELCRLADFFNVSVDSLLGRSPLNLPATEIMAADRPISSAKVRAASKATADKIRKRHTLAAE